MNRTTSESTTEGVTAGAAVTLPAAEPLFLTGRVQASAEALGAIAARYDGDPEKILLEFVERHTRGHWSHMDAVAQVFNRTGIQDGLPIFSIFHLAPFPSEEERQQPGEPLYVYTNGDRTITLVSVEQTE